MHMKERIMRGVFLGFLLVLMGSTPTTAKEAKEESKEKAWTMTATAIEACSCPVGTRPATHAGKEGKQHFCRFNSAYRINTGTWGTAKLDGAKFWMFGDRGEEFSDGDMDWMVLTFDRATNMDQREAILEIVPKLFPVSWKTFRTAVGDIEWVVEKNRAYAILDTAKVAEVKLASSLKPNAKPTPTVVGNSKYWGAKSNDAIVVMPSTLNVVRRGEVPFEYKGTNGFMVTFTIDSKTAASASGGSGF
jgi:hypothetical protein